MSAWFFRTSIPSVTPVRSLTRCAEPTALGFYSTGMYVGVKTTPVSHAPTTPAISESLIGAATLW
jgi:hypothetical protein